MNTKDHIENLINRFYETISGKKGESRDWENFKQLFVENASLIPKRNSNFNECCSRVFKVDEYIQKLDSFLQTNDFYEYGFDYQIEIQSDIAQVKSRYKNRTLINDTKLMKSGTNFILVLFDGCEWKISAMLWQDDEV